MVISELGLQYFGNPYETYTLTGLGGVVYPITGTRNNDPTYNERFDYNVTTSLQRYINGSYTDVRGFVLTADEDFLTNFDSSTIDPDFYFNEFHFFGFAAADSLRPHLQITYSSVAGLGGDKDE